MTLFDPRMGVFGLFKFIRKELHDDPPIVHDTVGPFFRAPSTLHITLLVNINVQEDIH
jgi:hypothetical protein